MKWIKYELWMWNQVKLWSSQLWTQFLQLRREAWKFQDFNRIFQASLRNCKNCVHNCEDHSFTWLKKKEIKEKKTRAKINIIITQFHKKIRSINILCSFFEEIFSYQKLMSLKHFTLVQSWGFCSLRISLFGCNLACKFSCTCSFDLIFVHIWAWNFGVLKFPALFQGKELQVTFFKVMCFCFHSIHGSMQKSFVIFVFFFFPSLIP